MSPRQACKYIPSSLLGYELEGILGPVISSPVFGVAHIQLIAAVATTQGDRESLVRWFSGQVFGKIF